MHPDANKPYQWAFGTPTTPIAVIPVDVVEKAFRSIATVQKINTTPTTAYDTTIATDQSV
jgi:hypothetical protein